SRGRRGCPRGLVHPHDQPTGVQHLHEAGAGHQLGVDRERHGHGHGRVRGRQRGQRAEQPVVPFRGGHGVRQRRRVRRAPPLLLGGLVRHGVLGVGALLHRVGYQGCLSGRTALLPRRHGGRSLPRHRGVRV
ncbi:unnamed protein product, partial [Ectocarpus fasciculatus]